MSRNKRRSKVVSDVQNVSENTFIPPGGSAPQADKEHVEHSAENTEANGAQGGDAKYPASVKTSEQLTEEQNKAADEREARAKRATGPRRLAEREVQMISVLLDMLPKNEEGKSDHISVTEYVYKLEEIPENIRDHFWATGSDRNLAQRGLAVLVSDPETKQPTGVKLTEIAMHLYGKQTSKATEKTPKQTSAKRADGKPVANGGRTTSKYEGLRLRKMVDQNPRQAGTQGYNSWELYKDGMTYREYMATKDYNQVETNAGSMFRGPGRNHFDWDLMHGYISLYNEKENEFLENGEPNPNFWAVNNKI